MKRPPAGRLVGLFLVMVLAFAGVGGRLVILQVRDAEAYEALARDQRVREIELPADRGTIYDRALHELAISLPARAVYVNPRQIARPAAVARQVAPLLGLRIAQVRRSLSADTGFVYLARRVDVRTAKRIERLDIAGLGLLEESKRHYPGGDLAAHLLGYVGVDAAGLAGLELEHDDLLAGQAGSMVLEQDPLGRIIPQGEGLVVPPVPGRDLVLTIDRDLQFQAQRALEGAVESNGARGGMVIVMDPGTGEILAMATAPGFDANEYGTVPPEETRNRPVTDVYEPGSVNKVITAAAALERGVVGLRETFTVPDHHQVGDKMFQDSHPHPPMAMTITDIIAQSSNVGTIYLAQRLGVRRLDRSLRAFGFGRPTGVGFPGEPGGILMAHEDWWSTSVGTIPIGQGIAVTPLQMASVYATIANRGVRVEPRLVRGTMDEAGTVTPLSPARSERVVSPRSARLVTGMLAQAVDAGTGTEAQVPGYWVAGKTGTARKPLDGALGYSDSHVASFIGFLPARSPQLVVAAVLDEPVTVYGGVAAAPLFRDVARFALAHMRIAPTDPPRIPPTLVEG